MEYLLSKLSQENKDKYAKLSQDQQTRFIQKLVFLDQQEKEKNVKIKNLSLAREEPSSQDEGGILVGNISPPHVVPLTLSPRALERNRTQSNQGRSPRYAHINRDDMNENMPETRERYQRSVTNQFTRRPNMRPNANLESDDPQNNHQDNESSLPSTTSQDNRHRAQTRDLTTGPCRKCATTITFESHLKISNNYFCAPCYYDLSQEIQKRKGSTLLS